MISSFLLNFLLLMILGHFVGRWWASGKVAAEQITRIAFTIGLGWLLLSVFGYLVTPLFYDHGEANIASVSAYWLKGGFIYTPLDDYRRYSLLYGPWPYLVSAGFQFLLPWYSILMSKFAGALNLFIVLFAAVWLAKKEVSEWKNQLLLVSAVAVSLLQFYNITYWNRPDSYLIAYTFLAFLFVHQSEKFSKFLIYLAVGLLAGLASNCKIHGAIYFVPLAVYFVEKDGRNLRCGGLLLSVFAFVISFTGPFLLPSVGSEHFVDWLKIASAHGLSSFEVVNNMTTLAGFSLLVYLSGFSKRYTYTFWSLIFCGMVIAILGGKAGSGAHHFLPWMPIMIWLPIARYFHGDFSSPKSAFLILFSMLLTIGHNGFERQKRVAELLFQTPYRIAQFKDLQQAVEKYPGLMEMGYTKDYESALYKNWMVMQNRGLILDGAGVMDLDAANVRIPVATLHHISSCQTTYFIFSNKELPWSLGSFYEGRGELFSSEFKAEFFSKYKIAAKTTYYDIYSCETKN